MPKSISKAIVNNKGFTLIELLVVMVILGLLASIVGPKLFGRTDDAKIEAARVQIEHFNTALKMYKLDNGVFPTTDQGLQALVSPPQGGDAPKKWREGGYLEKKSVPKDPWGNDYIYLYPGVHGTFDIMCYGADGSAGGDGINKDINNWDTD